MRALWGIVVLGALSACLRTPEYKCSSSSQCASGGTCEASGYCSFADSSCASGRKYGDFSGANGGKCVDGDTIDAGIDVPIDMGNPNCPMGYTAMGSSSYRVSPTQDDWLAAEKDCEDDGMGTHLIIVSDAQEQMTLDTLANGTMTWIGSSDRVAEGMWFYVTGADSPDLGNTNNADCALNAGNPGMASDATCNTGHAYVCECDGVAAMPSSYTP